jgi:hypothetical protein
MPPKKTIEELIEPSVASIQESPLPQEGDMVKIKKRVLTPEALEKLALARQKAHEVVRAKGKIARQIRDERGMVASKLAKQYVEDGILPPDKLDKPTTTTTQKEEKEQVCLVDKPVIMTERSSQRDLRSLCAKGACGAKHTKTPPVGVRKVVKKKVIYYTDEPEEISIEEEVEKPLKPVSQTPTVPKARKQTTNKKTPSQVDNIISSFY